MVKHLTPICERSFSGYSQPLSSESFAIPDTNGLLSDDERAQLYCFVTKKFSESNDIRGVLSTVTDSSQLCE